MAKKIQWGVLSTARHAEKLVIPAIDSASNGEVIAVASRDEARAQEFAGQLGIPNGYGSYEALLADPGIDAVYIPLPNNLHKEWTIRALRAGKHVLCEKPIALDAAEAEEMAAVSRETRKVLAETFQWRHHPRAKRMRELVREGVIGDMKLLDAGFSFKLEREDDIRWDPDLGGGALYDLGCYPISFMRYITRQEPLRVTAQATWSKSGVDDLVVATLEFPNDVLAHLNCSFIVPVRRYYEVVGVTGSLRANRTYNPVGDQPAMIERLGTDREIMEVYDMGQQDSYVLMVEDFNRALLEGTDPMFPAEDAVKNMRVIDAIFKAAREGGTVEVAQ